MPWGLFFTCNLRARSVVTPLTGQTYLVPPHPIPLSCSIVTVYDRTMFRILSLSYDETGESKSYTFDSEPG